MNLSPVYTDIKLIGKKIFMNHKETLSEGTLTQFMPLLDVENYIIGSQMIFTEGNQHKCIYEFHNQQGDKHKWKFV